MASSTPNTAALNTRAVVKVLVDALAALLILELLFDLRNGSFSKPSRDKEAVTYIVTRRKDRGGGCGVKESEEELFYQRDNIQIIVIFHLRQSHLQPLERLEHDRTSAECLEPWSHLLFLTSDLLPLERAPT